MRIVALDDKKEWILIEERITQQYCRERGEECIFKGYDNVATFLADLQGKERPEIYLLDVEMPDADGLHVATEIKKKCAEPIIIYITDYPQYAPRGYEVNAYRYILKEQIEEKLPEAYDSLAQKRKCVQKNYYVWASNNEAEQILQDNIYYIKKEKKYIVLITENGEKKERKSLQEIKEELSDDCFIYIDKGVVINIRHAMRLEGDMVKMRDGERFVVSRPRLKLVKQKIMEYWGKRI